MNEGAINQATDEVLYASARGLVLAHRNASVALVQRHLRLGYGAACALFGQMQEEGVVVPVPGENNRWKLARSFEK